MPLLQGAPSLRVAAKLGFEKDWDVLWIAGKPLPEASELR